MKMKFYERFGKLPDVPFLTLEGAAEIETVGAAAHIAAKDCYPEYPGRVALSSILPRPLNGVQHSIHQAIARKRGLEGYQQLGSFSYHEGLNHKDSPDFQRLELIEDAAERATKALDILARADPKVVAHEWGAQSVPDVVVEGQSVSGLVDVAGRLSDQIWLSMKDSKPIE